MRGFAYRGRMDAFERFVAVALEADACAVYEGVRFCVEDESATGTQDGCEVAVVAARPDCLVLAMVRSLFASRGVVAEHVTGETKNPRCRKRYEVLNDRDVRAAVVQDAAERFGYEPEQVVLRLYVAKFATHGRGRHEERVREWCADQTAGSGPIEVVGVKEVLMKVRTVVRREGGDDPVLKTIEFLDASGFLTLVPEPAA